MKVSSTAIALSPADLLAQHRVPWEGASTPMDHVIAYAHALGIAATISDDPLKGQALRHLKGLTKIGATPDEIYACTRWLTDTWAANARRNNSEPVTPTPSQVAANFTRFRAAKPKVAPPVAKPTPVEAFPKPGREGRYCVSFWNAVFGDQNPLDEDILALLLARRQDPARDGYVVRGTANPPLSDRIEITDFAFQPEGWTYDPEEYARVVALAADKK